MSQARPLVGGQDSISGSSLTFPRVTRHQAGLYTCTADNGGPGAKAEAKVRIEIIFLHVKPLLGAFYKEKALIGAFSGHCDCDPVTPMTALLNTGVAGAVGRAARTRDRAGGDLHPQPGRGGGELLLVES